MAPGEWWGQFMRRGVCVSRVGACILLACSRDHRTTKSARCWNRSGAVEYELFREAAAKNSIHMPSGERASYLAALEAAIKVSEHWFGEGCTPRRSLGIHDYPGGENDVRLVEFPRVARWEGHD